MSKAARPENTIRWPSYDNVHKLLTDPRPQTQKAVETVPVIATRKMDGTNVGMELCTATGEPIALLGRNYQLWSKDDGPLAKYTGDKQYRFSAKFRTDYVAGVQKVMSFACAARHKPLDRFCVYGELMGNGDWHPFGCILVDAEGRSAWTQTLELHNVFLSSGLCPAALITPSPLPLLELVQFVHQMMLTADDSLEGVFITAALAMPGSSAVACKYKTPHHEEQPGFDPSKILPEYAPVDKLLHAVYLQRKRTVCVAPQKGAPKTDADKARETKEAELSKQLHLALNAVLSKGLPIDADTVKKLDRTAKSTLFKQIGDAAIADALSQYPPDEAECIKAEHADFLYALAPKTAASKVMQRLNAVPN